MQRASVLFPEPLGPITDTTSPSANVSEMSFKTLREPKDLLRRLTSNTGKELPLDV